MRDTLARWRGNRDRSRTDNSTDRGLVLDFDVTGVAPSDRRAIHDIAGRFHVGPGTAHALLDLRPDDTLLVYILADRPRMDASVMARLAETAIRLGHRDGGTWARIAEHPATPAHVLELMVRSQTPWPDRAAANPKADAGTVDAFLALYPHGDWSAISCRPDLTPPQIATLAERYLGSGFPDWHALARMARLPQAPAAYLQRLAEAMVADAARSISGLACARAVPALLSHPDAPIATLAQLPWDRLVDRHRAMLLARLLGTDAQAELATRLWDTFTGTVADVARLIVAITA